MNGCTPINQLSIMKSIAVHIFFVVSHRFNGTQDLLVMAWNIKDIF